MTLFNLYVDPKFVGDKERLIDILTPIVYKHFCEIFGLDTPDKQTCIENIESFTNAVVLPQRDGVFVSSG
ncbi:MAG: hypothetical protein H6765_07625 [Candidatus Peribacteria bacterium]|nr:MAG: hypothetical protein H6765_07625 [Candidatus Peribacteria bacterium]